MKPFISDHLQLWRPFYSFFQGASSFLYSYWQTQELQNTQVYPSQILAYGCARQHPGVGTGSTTPWSSVVWMTTSYRLTRPAIVVPLTAPTGPASSSAALNPLGTLSSLLSSWKLRERNPIAVHPPFLGTVRGKHTLLPVCMGLLGMENRIGSLQENPTV